MIGPLRRGRVRRPPSPSARAAPHRRSGRGGARRATGPLYPGTFRASVRFVRNRKTARRRRPAGACREKSGPRQIQPRGGAVYGASGKRPGPQPPPADRPGAPAAPGFIRRGWFMNGFFSRALPVVAALGLTAAASPAGGPAPLERRELDRRTVKTLYDAAVAGSDIFNKGNAEGCYRLYQGTLRAVAPTLDHRPAVKAAVEAKLKQAEGLGTAADRAFLLRKALDETYLA